MKATPTKIVLDADSYASITDVSHCCGGVRVEGWIHGKNRTHIFEACKVLAAHFGRKSVGAFCMEESDTSAAFSFDELPSLTKYYQYETKEELLARVQGTIRKAVRAANKAMREQAVA